MSMDFQNDEGEFLTNAFGESRESHRAKTETETEMDLSAVLEIKQKQVAMEEHALSQELTQTTPKLYTDIPLQAS